MPRVFLVDAHPIVRAGVRALLVPASGFEVVGEASHAQELFEQLPTTPTDALVLDASLSVPDGLSACQRLRAEFPAVRVLVLSLLDHAPYVGQFLEAGAAGCLLKNAQQQELLAALQTILAGRQFLCSDLGLHMLRKVLATFGSASALPAASRLTRRETEVLHLLAEGFTTNEIAEKLFTSKRTIETHRQNMLGKTQTRNTAALIRLAVTRGLLE